jgi:hypothetical protein
VGEQVALGVAQVGFRRRGGAAAVDDATRCAHLAGVLGDCAHVSAIGGAGYWPAIMPLSSVMPSCASAISLDTTP